MTAGRAVFLENPVTQTDSQYTLRAMSPERKKLSHEIPPWVDSGAVYFLTLCCRPRHLNQLCHVDIAATIMETVRFRQHRHDWFMHLLLLMPDHLHCLVSFPKESDMRRVIANWKEIIAKSSRIQWQRDYFDHRLRNTESYSLKAHYISENPVRAGMVSKAGDWLYVWDRFD